MGYERICKTSDSVMNFLLLLPGERTSFINIDGILCSIWWRNNEVLKISVIITKIFFRVSMNKNTKTVLKWVKKKEILK